MSALAALYDIHGNLPALEAVLEDVSALSVDEVVIGGDVVPGPMASECLDLIRSLEQPVRCIRGNGEVALLSAASGDALEQLPEPVRDVIRWTASHLRPEHLEWIASWPPTVRLDVSGVGRVLACHGTPRHDNEIFTRETDEARLVPVFAEVDADLVVCGHTHMPFDRMVGHTRVVNAGSVGMPFGAPGADWLVIGPTVEPRHTAFDLSEAAARFRATEYPQVEQAVDEISAPRPVDEMLRIFSQAELRYGARTAGEESS